MYTVRLRFFLRQLLAQNPGAQRADSSVIANGKPIDHAFALMRHSPGIEIQPYDTIRLVFSLRAVCYGAIQPERQRLSVFLRAQHEKTEHAVAWLQVYCRGIFLCA